jgi:predicted metal-dependent peptidase
MLRMAPGKVAEFYYRSLARASPPPIENPDCGSGCHGQNDGETSLLLPGGLSDVEALLLRRRVAEEIVRAVAGRPGTVPGDWMRWAQATLHPQLDWRKLLSAKVRSSVAAVAGAADYSYARPPRRRLPRTVLPSLRYPVPRVAVIVDTSGSVPEHLLGLAWTEVHGCLRSLGIRRDLLTVYAADVHAHRLAGPPKRQMVLTGGGGTDMAEAIRVALAARPMPDLVVVITDGETGWPAARQRRDVIVALLGSSASRVAPPPWTHVIYIPDQQVDRTLP